MASNEVAVVCFYSLSHIDYEVLVLANRRDTKNSTKMISLLKVLSGSDLPVRLEKISGQTGLSPLSLLKKWILQEETLIGLMQCNKEPMAEQAGTRPNVTKQKNPDVQKKKVKAVPSEPGDQNYRKALIKRAIELKKSGISLKKIAETYNEENVSTLSGTGKWYASSIANLLSSKK